MSIQPGSAAHWAREYADIFDRYDALRQSVRTEDERDLAKILHDIAHPDGTHLAPGTIYKTLAERLHYMLTEHPGELYEWLSDRTKDAFDG